MKKPIIGVVGSLSNESGKNIMESTERVFTSEKYVNCVEKVGGIPIVLPHINEILDIKRQIELCDGLLLCGGADIHPIYYGEEPYEKLGFVNSKEDEYQIKVTRMALNLHKPILGVCRGHQLLNVVCGGTLYQDMEQVPSKTIKHNQISKRYEPYHSIKIVKNSILEKILGNTILVNSIHHQCIKELGKGLRVIATSKDGVIEAVEMGGRDFVVGVQWHPEEMAMNNDENMLNIFKEFIDKSVKVELEYNI
ncbi:putative glutamine amidotransferase-like protein [Gottschalkia acidurici 9a]|uniref:Glutamine amidotransferase-like protein n=1 Tax=Gottschalkia acidurici (strain ATCC 7906 / DSM 604 / BCRC 14475 / CIP 104303 / KCTC 5404 / NCIMB 10678 / 9a) TaxID=1128398 RepID=K0AY66_GOTA9|nr:gamma-glutamyl-gamma-aminobutyrate hydrolase family protein [Gottschalkia acidurici]AFS78184.1 putative glutamine amidotransferase-like protein [Gottschalkia acidurici 9a]